MTELVGLLILILVSIPLLLSIRRSNELFCLDVARGKAHRRRGHLPQGLLDDVEEVVRRPVVRRASIRVTQERGRPRVYVRGKMPDGQLQRLRNVVGAYPVAKIKGGKR